MKEKEHYLREKERYYKEKQSYEQASYDVHYMRERDHREKRDEVRVRHSDSRKYEDKKLKESRDIREVRYSGRESEKYRREKNEEERKEKFDEERREKSTGEKTLQDLRDRLLSKRHVKDDEGRYEGDSHRGRKHKEGETADPALSGEAGVYIKEMIDMTMHEEKKYKKEEKKEEDKLTEKERVEQELRREKLLEAGKCMVSQFFSLYDDFFLQKGKWLDKKNNIG